MLTQTSWPRAIPVSVQLPERFVDVLAFSQEIGWMQAAWCGHSGEEQWYMAEHDDECSRYLSSVTHWLPLPPRPELSDA